MEIFLVDMGIFSNWWYQDYFDKLTVQSDTYLELIHENRNYTLAYIIIDEFDAQSYNNKILQLLGGQVHVQCDLHKLPLIFSR